MEYLVDAVGPVEIAAGVILPHRGFPVQPLNLILRRLQFRGQVCYLVTVQLGHHIQIIPVIVVVSLLVAHGIVSFSLSWRSMYSDTARRTTSLMPMCKATPCSSSIAACRKIQSRSSRRISVVTCT